MPLFTGRKKDSPGTHTFKWWYVFCSDKGDTVGICASHGKSVVYSTSFGDKTCITKR